MDSPPPPPDSPAARPRPPARFATTRWSVVLDAGRAEAVEARDALANLCGTYWFPLYAHVRRRGYNSHDAQDLTQEFFARLLERGTLGRADPTRGRFRSFILAVLDRFLQDEWKKRRAQKRGGGRDLVSLDVVAAEQRLELESLDALAPDKAFDRHWAQALLDRVMQQLEDDYRREGKAEMFAALRSTLGGARESQPYAELAAQLGSSEGAMKVAVHRLRKRYRARLESEVADTVATADDVSTELRHLLGAMA